MSRSPAPEVIRRILELCLQMEDQLNENSSMETLAKRAHLSKFHFQRIFRQVVGESVATHLRRLRLERASYFLRCSDMPIGELAETVGFSTHAGFTHAFTRLFGISPQEFRDQPGRQVYLRYHSGMTLPQGDQDRLARCPLTVQLITLPPFILAMRRFVGPIHRMVHVWPELLNWARQKDLLSETTRCFGIHRDDWGTDSAHYRYDACLTVPNDFITEGETTCLKVPGGLTAICAFEGSLQQMDLIWQRFFQEWLPVSGYQPSQSFVFDEYPLDLVSGSPMKLVLKSLTGIRATLCIPVSSAPLPVLVRT